MGKTLIEKIIATFRKNSPDKGERLDQRNLSFTFTKKIIEGRYSFARKFVKDKRVLDIACGDGYGSSIIAKLAKEVVGIDYDEETIKRNNYIYGKTNLKFKVGDGNNIKIKEKFDTIVSFETIEHLKNGQKFVHHLYELLNENGVLILSTPDHKFKDLFFKGRILCQYHLKEYYQNELVNLLKNAGFCNIQTFYYHITNEKFKSLSFVYFFLMRGFRVFPKSKKSNIVPVNAIFVAKRLQ